MKKYISYTEILQIIKNKNVELRHDVDISLKSAFNIAKLEKESNIKSIFYIRFDCDYYNLLSLENQIIIQFLKQNHEIGCHVDATNVNNEEDLINYLDFYNNIIPFKKFTFHINTEKTKSFGFINKYENKSILDKDYISDSKNNFTMQHLDRLTKLHTYTLLTHPEWWDNNDFLFNDEVGDKKLLNSLRLNDLYDKSIREILGYTND